MNDASYIPRLYGRQQGPPLKRRHAQLMETLLPRFAVPMTAAVDLASLFPGADDIQLEVGFGGGEHLAWQAAQHPNTGFIGAEPFINGVAKLLAHIDDQKLENVRVHHGDVRPLLEALPDGALSKLFVLHPDPWPKKRHFKRRMISPWFFSEAARLLRSGGELRVASDIRDYIRWTLMHAQNAPDFEWTANEAADWKRRPGDWPQTRYEAKSLREGRTPAYLIFRRK
jgi:tRNA (guanine-N7-)-methyltransferase